MLDQRALNSHGRTCVYIYTLGKRGVFRRSDGTGTEDEREERRGDGA